MDNAPPPGPSPRVMLREVLDEAGWGPRDLTRAVNTWLASRGRSNERIDTTAAYPWVRFNYCPHNSIPEVVAVVLTDRIGRYISADELWPGHARAKRVARCRPLSTTWSIDDAIRSLDQLASGGQPAPMSSTELTVAAISGLRERIEPHVAARGRDRVPQSQAELIANHVAALRRLDDRQGGGALSLRYVSRELASVLDLVRCGSYDFDAGQILLTSVADLAQLAGWMEFDAGAAETAQLYLQLGIRIARAAHDDERAANNAGMLAYIAAEADEGANGLAILEAAAALPTTSLLLQARLAGRRATAHAAVGDIAAFHKFSDRALELLGTSRQDHTHPYLYYLTTDQLAAEAGYSLVALAQWTESQRRPLLKHASGLLTPRAHLDHDPGYKRSAVLHGCQLTQVYLMLSDLDAAVAAARRATTHLTEVQSGRCVAKLRQLLRMFAQRRRSRVVAEFLPELEAALRRCA